MPYLQRLAYVYRGLLVCLPLIAAVFCTWNEYRNHLIAWIAGGIVFGLGLWIRIWSQQHLRFRLRTGMKLTQTGPYELCRNPIYIGNTLICLGLVTASGLLWLVPITLATCMITYGLVVRHEERKLTRMYGDPYVQFLSEVPRWVPKPRKGYRPSFVTDQLKPSVRAEMYNLLLLAPFILKEIFR